MSTNIAMWSGPRNISTAMMYSFGNRPDCVAWDEPFYAFSLVHHGNDHPMRDDIIAANDSDWDRLVSRCLAPADKPVFYQKHMTHHMLKGYDRSLDQGPRQRLPRPHAGTGARELHEEMVGRDRCATSASSSRPRSSTWWPIIWAMRRPSSMPTTSSPIRAAF